MSARPEQLRAYTPPKRARARRLRAAPAARGEARATLGRVCADLGPELLQVAIAPRGLDVAVGAVRMHDPFDPLTVASPAGQVLLAIGVDGHDERACDLIAAASACRAVAVVCKARGPLTERLIAASDAAGVALLTAEPAVAWEELYDLLRAAMATDEHGALRRGAARGLLFGLVEATAVVTGGAVRIEDPHGRVLAFSQNGRSDALAGVAARGGCSPERWLRTLRRHGVLERLLASEHPIDVALPGAPPWRAIAVRAGGVVLGSVWLGEAGDDADTVLREAARRAATQLMRDGIVDDLECRVNAGIVRKLLEGRPIAHSELERLGLGEASGYVVAAVEAAGGAEIGGASPSVERLADLAALHLQAYRHSVVATALDGRCYVLAAADADGARAALGRTLQDFVNRTSGSLRTDVRAGLGNRVIDLGEIAEARRAADRCVQLGDAPNRVVAYEEIHGRALLADVQAFLTDHGVSVSRELAVLREHDREHGTDYIATLRTCLDALGDAGRAASELAIHVNTFRYRMRRIVEITGVDFADAEARFALELELRTLGAAAP